MTLANVSFAVAMADTGVTGTGKTAGDKKMSALAVASGTAMRLIGHGTGKVAKAARSGDAMLSFEAAAVTIAAGDLGCFAAIVAAKLGRSVQFRKSTAPDGSVTESASQSFRAYRAILNDLILQEQGKAGGGYNEKGLPKALMGELLGLLQLHTAAVRCMDARDAADAERRAKQAEERAAAERDAEIERLLSNTVESVEG